MDPATDPAWGETRGWRAWALPVVLVVLLLGVLATSVVLAVDRVQQHDAVAVASPTPAYIGPRGATGHKQADAAVNVARRAVRSYFTLDPRTVDSAAKRMRMIATSDFEGTYAAKVRALRDQVTAQGLTISASLPVNGTATEYLSDIHAQVLVSVDVHKTARQAAPTTVRVATRVSLDRVGLQWRVARLDQLG